MSITYMAALSILFLGTLSAANSTQKKDFASAYREIEDMNRDEIDDTSTLAIPADDSELEDEEQINRLNKRKEFPS